MAKEETTTYLIEKEDGTRMTIEVPSSWKVTFGPAAKGNNSSPRSTGLRYKIPMALRFYENETKQRAIFTDVVSFRDTSIPVKIEKTEVQEKEGYTECEGVRQRSTFQVKTKKWINPDEVADSQPVLPALHNDFDE